MFVSDERPLTVSFEAASSRLDLLVRRVWLRALSETVHDGGTEYLLRVGPLGTVPGVSRLVRIRFTEPIRHDRTMSVGLRWEATGVTGGLFPALDADIRVSDDGGQAARVTLTGSCRARSAMG